MIKKNIVVTINGLWSNTLLVEISNLVKELRVLKMLRFVTFVFLYISVFTTKHDKILRIICILNTTKMNSFYE